MSLDEFQRQLVASELFTEAEVRAFLNELGPAKKPKSAEAFAKALVKAKKLTAYQAQVIYQGKGKSLTLGNYVILDKLGAGGMGQVYRAEHRRMERVVALKILPPALMKENNAVERFHREVKAAARLTHPNIVTAHDADETKGVHYLVMEHVGGSDLSSLVKRKGPFSVDKAVNCIVQAAKGLEYAHSQNVIHRDIKPSNLLLDETGTVKVLDMGLARFNDEVTDDEAALTGTGAVMGTIDYMSPEQAVNTKHANERADIYSLGVTLFFLLTGKPAYSGSTVMERLIAHREAALPSLTELCPEVNSSLDAVFRKMIAKKPADRYQTMSQVIAALEQSLSSSGASAPTIHSATSEDSKLNAFLANFAGSESAEEFVAISTDPLEPTQIEATVQMTGKEEPTDPNTVTSLPTPSRKNARKNSPSWMQNKKLLAGIGGGLLALVVVLIAAFGGGRDNEQVTSTTTPKSTVPGDANTEQASPDNRDLIRDSAAEDDGPNFALHFNGIDQYAEFSKLNLDGIRLEGSLTLEARVRADAIQDSANVLTWMGENWIALYQHRDANGDFGWGVGRRTNNGSIMRRSVGTVEPGQWIDLCAIWNGSEFDLFIDGKKQECRREEFPMEPMEGGLFIGGAPVEKLTGHTAGRWFHGAIDWLKISRGEVYSSDYDPTNSFSRKTDALLIIGFDEGEGLSLTESSRFNRKGTNHGATWEELSSLPQANIDRNREVAEWVLSVGGTAGIRSEGERMIEISPDDPLPNKPYKLVTVDLAQNNKVNDADLVRFDTLEDLTTIILTGNNITDAGVRNLKTLPNLHAIYLPTTKVTDDAVRYLARFQNLKILHLSKSQVTTESLLLILQQFPDLEDFHLTDIPLQEEDVTRLVRLRSLKVLNITNTGISKEQVERLHELLPGCIIRSDFGSRELTHDGPVYFDEKSNDRAAAEFAIKKGIGASVNYRSGGYKFFETLEDLPKEPVRIVTADFLDSQTFQPGELKVFNRLPYLGVLSFSNSNLTDALFAELGELPSLEKLYLYNTKLSNKAAETLLRYPRIDVLHLTDVPLDNQFVEQLTQLPRLAVCELGGSRIDDSAIDSLAKIKSLQRVTLQRTLVTKAGVDRLRVSLPECHVESDFGFFQGTRELPVKPSQSYVGHTNRVRGIEWLPDGERFVSIGWDGRAIQWDANDGKILFEYPLTEGNTYLGALAISPDQKTLAVGGSNHRVYLWDLDAGENSRAIHLGQDSQSIISLCFSPDGKRLYAGCGDTLKSIDITTAQKTSLEQQFPFPVYDIDISSDGKWLALALNGIDQNVILWDMSEKRAFQTYAGHRFAASHVEFFDEDSVLISCGSDGFVRWWTTKSSRELGNLRAHDGPVENMVVDVANNFLYTGGADKKLNLFQLDTHRRLFQTRHDQHVFNQMALSPDGNSLLTGGGYFWNSKTSSSDSDGEFPIYRWNFVEEESKRSTALDMSGKDFRVEFPEKFPNNIPYTVEMWVTPQALMEGRISRRIWHHASTEIKAFDNAISYSMFNNIPEKELKYVAMKQAIVPGQRIHLAATFDLKHISLFIDGKLIGRETREGPLHQFASSVLLGTENYTDNYQPFLGTIDEFRMSTNVRYEKDFTPVEQFISDDNTWVLFHFDEGSGDALRDASGNNRDGKIFDPKWVKSK